MCAKNLQEIISEISQMYIRAEWVFYSFGGLLTWLNLMAVVLLVFLTFIILVIGENLAKCTRLDSGHIRGRDFMRM